MPLYLDVFVILIVLGFSEILLATMSVVFSGGHSERWRAAAVLVGTFFAFNTALLLLTAVANMAFVALYFNSTYLLNAMFVPFALSTILLLDAAAYIIYRTLGGPPR